MRPTANPISVMGKACHLTGQHRLRGVAPDFPSDTCDINNHATGLTSRALLFGIKAMSPSGGLWGLNGRWRYILPLS